MGELKFQSVFLFVDELSNSFDRVDSIFQKQEFLAEGTSITEADVRLFVTLLRFDEGKERNHCLCITES